MEKDILSQVIEVEKEIQKCLDAEKVKVREWLEEVKRETEEDSRHEVKKLNESLEQSLAEAAKHAELKAAEIVDQASGSVEKLKHLKKEMLTRIIERQITRILPG